jgi:hypothetical protein
MKTKRKTKKTRIGSSFVLALALAALASGADKKRAPEPYGILAGTVFREPGFALPGAEVTALSDDSELARNALKRKKLSAVSNARGEFAFRVPTAAARYTVKAAAKGYQAQEKTVSIEGEQRVDVTFTLRAESK